MSKIRVSEIRVREIRVRKIRVREIRVSKIRISSNNRELHGAIFQSVHSFDTERIFQNKFSLCFPNVAGSKIGNICLQIVQLCTPDVHLKTESESGTMFFGPQREDSRFKELEKSPTEHKCTPTHHPPPSTSSWR